MIMSESLGFEYEPEVSLDLGTNMVLVPEWNHSFVRRSVPKWDFRI